MTDKRFFGTDGVRGRVGHGWMTPEFVLRLGWAAGRVMATEGNRLVLIGKDTRISGYMFESVLEAGLSAAGVRTHLLGPMPTPGVAYLTRTFRANIGIVISASHNPYYDNGIKFFSHSGEKLTDHEEHAIELCMEKPMKVVESPDLGKVFRVGDAAGRYIEFCKSTVPTGTSFQGLRIVLDCANGATYQIAPAVFSELGATIVTMGDHPDGLNINAGCGSTDPGRLSDAVLQHGADLGIALDGDGDRVIMVDAEGEVVDGDDILFILAESRRGQNRLRGGIVGTLMSNYALEKSLQSRNIPFIRADVGDRYVNSKLREKGWEIGGETSGHIICLNHHTTGDGIIAALAVLSELVTQGKSLRDLRGGLSKYPQVLVNVMIAPDIEEWELPEIRDAIAEIETELAGKGRILVRKSGTEPLLRIMVESPDYGKAHELANQVAALAAEKLGTSDDFTVSH